MDSKYRYRKYRIEREVLDEQRLEELAQRKPYADTSVINQFKDSIRCTVPKLKHGVLSTFPVLYWLPKYSVWDSGMPDLISGISVGIMHLPQGMAYALLASLPPVFGLYTSLYPALIYFFFGTSRHISIGTFAVLSIMVGSVTERLAPDVDFLKVNGTNVTTEVDIAARDSYRVQVAAATTVLGGLIQVVLGLVKFGFVGTYLSEPLVRAYTTAAALHAVVAQLKYIFGVSPARFNGPLSLLYKRRRKMKPIEKVQTLTSFHAAPLACNGAAVWNSVSVTTKPTALTRRLLLPAFRDSPSEGSSETSSHSDDPSFCGITAACSRVCQGLSPPKTRAEKRALRRRRPKPICAVGDFLQVPLRDKSNTFSISAMQDIMNMKSKQTSGTFGLNIPLSGPV